MLLRAMVVSLLAAGAMAGCASTQRVTSGGYYCLTGTNLSCPEHEGTADCQLCPKDSLRADSGTPR